MYVTYQQLDWLTMESSLTLSAADSLAKTSAQRAKAQDWPEQDQHSGGNTGGSLRKLRRRGLSQKTSQPFVIGDWTKFSGASLRSGMTRNGTVYPLQPLAPLTDETVSGLLPTPTTMANQLAPSMQKHAGCRRLFQMMGGRNGRITPTLYEWMMGFPIGWTDLKHSETP
jgi:hypothetical protein